MPKPRNPPAYIDGDEPLRLWTIGEWRYQRPGQPVVPITDGAAHRLLKLLAIRPEGVSIQDLQEALGVESEAAVRQRASNLRKELADARPYRIILPGTWGEGAFALGEEVWVDHVAMRLRLDESPPHPSAHLLAHPIISTTEQDDYQAVFPGVEHGTPWIDQERKKVVEDRSQTPSLRLGLLRNLLPEMDLAKDHTVVVSSQISSRRPVVFELLDRLNHGERVVIWGPAGVGKGHLAVACGVAAASMFGWEPVLLKGDPEVAIERMAAPIARSTNLLFILDDVPTGEFEVHAQRLLERHKGSRVLGTTIPKPTNTSAWAKRLSRLIESEREELYFDSFVTFGGDRDDTNERERFKTWQRRIRDLRTDTIIALARARAGSKSKSYDEIIEEWLDKEVGALEADDAKAIADLSLFCGAPFTGDDARAVAQIDEAAWWRLTRFVTTVSGRPAYYELKTRFNGIGMESPDAAHRLAQLLLRGLSPQALASHPATSKLFARKALNRQTRVDLLEACTDAWISSARHQAGIEFAASIRDDCGSHVEHRARCGLVEARLRIHRRAPDDLYIAKGRVQYVLGKKTLDRQLRGSACVRQLELAFLADSEAAETLAARVKEEHPERVSEVAFLEAWHAFRRSRFADAVQGFETSLEDESLSTDWRAHGLRGLASAQTRLGHYSEAEEALSRAITETLSRDAAVIGCEIQFAELDRLRGLIQPGMARAEEALASAEPIGFPFLTVRAGHQLARLLIARGTQADLERASELTEAARTDTKREWVEIYLSHLRGRVEEERGNFESAADHFEQSLKFAQKSKDPWSSARTATALARVDLQIKESRSVGRYLKAATAAHAEMQVVCPHVLSATLSVGLGISHAYEIDGDVRQDLDDARGVASRPGGREELLAVLSPLSELAERVAGKVRVKRPTPPPAQPSTFSVSELGSLKGTFVKAAELLELSASLVRLGVVVPRDRPSIAAGPYFLDRHGESLTSSGTRETSTAVDCPSFSADPKEAHWIASYADALIVGLGESDLAVDSRSRRETSVGQFVAQLARSALSDGIAVIPMFELVRQNVAALFAFERNQASPLFAIALSAIEPRPDGTAPSAD